jgi:Rrf2 family nitric oxide-sensitive transcriptional repressor
LGTHPDRVIPTQEISGAYGISKNHLVRVIHTLAGCGYVTIHAGRSGGLTLACEPGTIRLGDVIRESEPSLRLAECFDKRTNTCPISSVCGLKRILNEALHSFLESLDQYTVADIVTKRDQRKLASVFATFAGWSG